MDRSAQDAEIVEMAGERASLTRELACMKNRPNRYQQAPSHASSALMMGIPLRDTTETVVTVSAVPGVHEGCQDRELPDRQSGVRLQTNCLKAQERIKGLTVESDDIGPA